MVTRDSNRPHIPKDSEAAGAATVLSQAAISPTAMSNLNPLLLACSKVDVLNAEAAITVVQSAFVFKGEKDSIRFEFTQFARGKLHYLDPLENKVVNLVDYRALQFRGSTVAAGGLYRYETSAPRELSIGWFGVEPNSQRSGFGTALLEHFIASSRERGAEVLSVYSPEDRNLYPGAQRFYVKNGFRPTEITVEYDVDVSPLEKTQIVWRKFELDLRKT